MSITPSFTALRVVELPDQDQGLQHAIVRVYSARLDRTRQDPSRFRRRQPVLIINTETGADTLRFVMGAGKGGVRKDEVSLDYDAIDALGVRFSQQVKLEVRPASRLEVLKHYFDHPDMSVQVSMRLALWGIFLGVFGAVCGVISIVTVFM